jgi:hypothetical protein
VVAPPGYPYELEDLVTLSDGRQVWVRPLIPADSGLLAEALARADPETLRRRFMGSTPPWLLLADRLATVDYRSRLALGGLDKDGELIAVTQYDGQTGSDTAEVAIAVDTRWCRVGLGTALLGRLAEAAVARGIRHFTAIYLVDNGPVDVLVRAVVRAAGRPIRQSTSRGVTEVIFDLPPREDAGH